MVGFLEKTYARALQPFTAPLTAASLLREAEVATGLVDWGGAHWHDGRFRERLDCLCTALENEAQLSALGRSRAHSRLHVLLCSRLRQIAWTGEQASKPAIVAPLIGAGLPRAGTTFLHSVLSQDPASLSATAAQAAIPIPPPGPGGEQEAERVALYARILDFQGFTAPDVTAIHPYAAEAPEECVFMQEGACALPLGAFFNVPSFAQLIAGPDAVADGYAWQKGVMETLQADRPEQRWVLKAPSHLRTMDGMITAFPDARIFMNHRDPGKVIPSVGSLYIKLKSLSSDARIDPEALGPQLVSAWAATLNTVEAWRAAHPEVTVVDVLYTRLIADPMGQAEHLYDACGLDLSQEARTRMEQFLKTDRHGKGPARAYSLGDFGLSEDDIEAAFGPYIDRHGIAREKRQ
jgi:hypothetical protein